MRFWQIDGVSRGKLIIVLILLYCLMVANVLVPTIRLSLQPANYLLFGLSQLIPFAALRGRALVDRVNRFQRSIECGSGRSTGSAAES